MRDIEHMVTVNVESDGIRSVKSADVGTITPHAVGQSACNGNCISSSREGGRVKEASLG